MGEFAVILINISKLLPCVKKKKKHIRIVKKKIPCTSFLLHIIKSFAIFIKFQLHHHYLR